MFEKWFMKDVEFKDGLGTKYVERKVRVAKVVFSGIAAFFILIALIVFFPFKLISPGYRGVVLIWGGKVLPTVLPEGLAVIVPIYQQVVEMNVQIQKAETDAAAASKDVQEAHAKIALNFHVSPERAWWVYQQTYGEYKARLIDPIVQEVFKAITARFTAIELITMRERVRDETKGLLVARLAQYGLILDDFSIINFSFSKTFMEAVEQKQTAEQLAYKAQNDLKRVEFEAKQKIATAQAEAESLRLRKTQIQDAPGLVQLEAIRKWDGKLPIITSGAMPWIDAGQLIKK